MSEVIDTELDSRFVKFIKAWKDNLEFIKFWLDRGEIREIAEECGLEPEQGYKILSGVNKNHKLFLKCFDRALERSKMYLAMEQQRIEVNEKISSI